MKKILLINNRDWVIDWTLGVVKTTGKKEEVYLLGKERFFNLGIQSVVKLILKWGVQHMVEYQKTYTLNKAVDFYYNLLAMNESYSPPKSMSEDLKIDLENYVKQEKDIIKALQEKGALELWLREEKIIFTYKQIEERIIVESGIKSTLESITQKWKESNFINMPDQIILQGAWSQCEWYTSILQRELEKEIKSFSHLKEKERNIIDTLVALSEDDKDYRQEIQKGSEIVLKYLNQEIILIPENEMNNLNFKGESEFKITFSLCPRITIDLLKRWQEDFQTKYEVLESVDIFHPLFYTGDEIRVFIKREDIGYKLEFVHMGIDTKRIIVIEKESEA